MAGEAAGQGERRGKAAGGGERQDVVTHRRACSQAAPEGEEDDAAAAAAGNYMSDAVLDGDKVYFPLVPEPDYRGVAHGDCAIGIVIA